MTPPDPTPDLQVAPACRRTLGVVSLAALWILFGASMKLLLGTPADLPAAVRGLPLDLGVLWKGAIAIELAVASLGLLRPRIGWMPVAALLFVFEWILAGQIASGAASCGCFGPTIPIPPLAMATVDGALLLVLLLARPWKNLTPCSAPLWMVGAALVLSGTLPLILDREATHGEKGDGQGGWVELDLEGMVGQNIWDTPLANHLEQDVYSLPMDGLWVLWRQDCEHCAAHFDRLDPGGPDTPMLILVQLRQDHDTEANRIAYPPAAGPSVVHATLRAGVDYVVTTPGELVLSEGVVTAGREGVDASDDG